MLAGSPRSPSFFVLLLWLRPSFVVVVVVGGLCVREWTRSSEGKGFDFHVPANAFRGTHCRRRRGVNYAMTQFSRCTSAERQRSVDGVEPTM